MGTVRRGARNIFRNPIRLVIVTILLGISFMFTAGMVALDAGRQEHLEELCSLIGPTINIWPRPAFDGSGAASAQADGLRDTLSEETLRDVAKVPGVESVYGRIEMQYTGSELTGSVRRTEGPSQASGEGAGDGTVPPMVLGVAPNDPQGMRVVFSTARIVAGRELTADDAEANVAIMGKALAEANDLDVGSRIDFEGKKVEIVGLYETSEPPANNSLILPLKTMQHLYGIDGVSSATVHVASGAQASDVSNKLRETLGDSVDIRSLAELCPER